MAPVHFDGGLAGRHHRRLHALHALERYEHTVQQCTEKLMRMAVELRRDGAEICNATEESSTKHIKNYALTLARLAECWSTGIDYAIEPTVLRMYVILTQGSATAEGSYCATAELWLDESVHLDASKRHIKNNLQRHSPCRVLQERAPFGLKRDRCCPCPRSDRLIDSDHLADAMHRQSEKRRTKLSKSKREEDGDGRDAFAWQAVSVPQIQGHYATHAGVCTACMFELS